MRAVRLLASLALPLVSLPACSSPFPESASSSSSAVTATTPPLDAGPVVGTPTFVDGGADPLSCTSWTAAECAATAPTISPDGTTGSCANAAYLACCSAQAATCTPWLQTLLAQTYEQNQAANASQFVLPPSIDGGSTIVTGVGHAEIPVTSVSTGTKSTVLGNQMAIFTTATQVGSTAGPTAQQLQNAQTAFNDVIANPRYTGQQIGSCDEYVWKKWQGYVEWEDAARAGINDPNYVASQTYTYLGLALPVRSDGLQFVYNATPFLYNYAEGATFPRSAFLSFTPTWLSSTDPTQSAILAAIRNEQAHPIVIGAANPQNDLNDVDWMRDCGGGELGCATTVGPNPWDYGVTTKVCAPPPVKSPVGQPEIARPRPEAITPPDCSEDTQWYPMTIPQDLADNEAIASAQARLDAYTSLLAELGDLNVELTSLGYELYGLLNCSNGVCAGVTKVPPAYPQISAPLLSGAAAPSTTQATPTFASYYFPDPGARRAAAVSYASAATALVAANPPPSTSGSGSSAALAVEQQMLAVQAQIATVQGEITQALENEWSLPNNGCLYGLAGGQYANICDFSPPTFVQSYIGMFEQQRQAAYNRCMADTGDQFPLDVAVFSAAGTPNFPTAAGFASNLESFENYLNDYENRDTLNAEYEQVLKATQQTYMNATTSVPSGSVTPNPAVGPCAYGGNVNGCTITVGQSMGDTHSVGNKYFSAWAQYGSSWSAALTEGPGTGGSETVDGVVTTVQGSLSAGVTVFGNNLDIISANLNASTAPGTANYSGNFAAFGVSLYNPGGSLTTAVNKNFDAPPASPSFSMIIPILCVPVKVSAGVTLAA
ncbi:MAG: hypothetical protein ACLQBL_35385, partial [Polyangiaceae bacterium]